MKEEEESREEGEREEEERDRKEERGGRRWGNKGKNEGEGTGGAGRERRITGKRRGEGTLELSHFLDEKTGWEAFRYYTSCKSGKARAKPLSPCCPPLKINQVLEGSPSSQMAKQLERPGCKGPYSLCYFNVTYNPGKGVEEAQDGKREVDNGCLLWPGAHSRALNPDPLLGGQPPTPSKQLPWF